MSTTRPALAICVPLLTQIRAPSGWFNSYSMDTIDRNRRFAGGLGNHLGEDGQQLAPQAEIRFVAEVHGIIQTRL